MHWSFRKYGFMMLSRSSQSCHVSLHNIINHHSSHQKSLKVLMVDKSFPRFKFLFESAKCITCSKYCCFSLNWLVHLVYFQENVRYLNMNNHGLSAVLSSKNSVLWKKWLLRFATQSPVLFLEINQCTWYAEVFMHFIK